MKWIQLLFSFLFLIHILSLPKESFSQDVGIDIATPTRAKLEVNGAVGSTSAIFGGESSGISLQRNWPSIGFNQYYNSGSKYIANGFAAVQYLDPVSGYFIFDMFPSGVKDATIPFYQRGLVISPDGNVGIRTNPTTATLYTVKSGNANGAAVFGGSVYNSHFYYDVTEDTYIRGGKDGSRVIINDIIGGRILMGNGNSHVSINNGIPSYPLEIRQRNGTGIKLFDPANNLNGWEMRMQFDPYYSPIDNLYMIYNGSYKCLFEGGDGYFYTFSDRRLKKHIKDIPSIMGKFMQLEPVEYNMKSFSTKQKKTAGFIAQDVQKLFPQLVAVVSQPGHGYPGLNELYGLNYNGFRMLTIKALQEQQEKIKEMQQQNEWLEKRISAAEKLLKGEKL